MSPHRWDHPRVRGADVLAIRAGAEAGGTIPACAGPTRTPDDTRGRAVDHPRVRGADPYAAVMIDSLRGPSPRARGRLQEHFPGVHVEGTIPACAGPTCRALTSAEIGRAHV